MVARAEAISVFIGLDSFGWTRQAPHDGATARVHLAVSS